MDNGKYNPLQLIHEYWPAANTNHIAYDPELVACEFEITRYSTHDGTFAFSVELVQRVLLPVVNSTCAYRYNPPPGGARLLYTVGPVTVRLLSVGLVKLPVGIRPGQHEMASMPVTVRW